MTPIFRGGAWDAAGSKPIHARRNKMKLHHTLIAAAVLLGSVAMSTTGCKSGACCDMKSKGAKSASVKPYPLKTCIVSGEKLGEMGEPVVFVHEGQEIKLCCKNCRKDFDKEPAKYLAKLAAK